jgi:hypothetical protein
MRVTPVAKAPIPDLAIQTRIHHDINAALSSVTTTKSAFVVNDTLWYAVNDKGKVTPCVVNSASFISGRFTATLAQLGWTPEKELDGQAFDAYLDLATATLPTYGITEGSFPQFFADYIATPEGAAAKAEGETLDRFFVRLYQALVVRSTPLPPATYPISVRRYLQPQGQRKNIRIGLEFETGNIASSFRAINKLSLLHSSNLIDAGVFVTSINKADCACRIWPTSNRNGSFEELQQRDYRNAINYPLWEYGFAPDSFSKSAPYLAPDGTTYTPTATGKKIAVGGVTYSVWTGDRGKQLLLP